MFRVIAISCATNFRANFSSGVALGQLSVNEKKGAFSTNAGNNLSLLVSINHHKSAGY